MRVLRHRVTFARNAHVLHRMSARRPARLLRRAYCSSAVNIPWLTSTSDEVRQDFDAIVVLAGTPLVLQIVLPVCRHPQHARPVALCLCCCTRCWHHRCSFFVIANKSTLHFGADRRRTGSHRPAAALGGAASGGQLGAAALPRSVKFSRCRQSAIHLVSTL